jgi:formylglycine-generating enzyme required for sulfatase activity
MSDCGSGESCCTSLEVTGDTYYRTYSSPDGGTDGATGEADPATVSSFRLDKYLVTVGRYRQFVAAYDAGTWTNVVTDGSGKHAHLNGGRGLANSGSAGTYETGWLDSDDGNVRPSSANLACSSGYPNWTDTVGSQENLPINCVNWWEAYAFCIWDGGFLPSEAEWEYAAAGGSQQLEYPWGSTAPGTACPGTGCQFAIYGCDYPNGAGHCTGVSNVAPVGTATHGAGRWGQLDLAGEVWEWNADFYGTYVDPCTDCADLTPGSERVLRGGSFFDDRSHLLPASRNHGASARGGTIGLRCARAP